MKYIKKYFVPIFLFFVSLAVIVPYLKSGFIIGSGESAIPVNPSYVNPFYLWSDKINLGNYFSSQSVVALFFVFWSLFETLFFFIHPSVVFVFLSFYLPALFLYILLDNLLKLDNKLIYLPGCLLYSFNVFRIQVTYQNEAVSLFFIFMPLFFLFYYKLLRNPRLKYVVILALLSSLSSTMGDNLSVFVVPYFLLFLYLVFSLLAKNVPQTKKTVFLNIFFAVLVLALNLFWLIPLSQALLVSYEGIKAGGPVSDFTDAGSYFDHFRLMGSWAWKSGFGYDKYFPFSSNYDKPILLATTFLIAVLPFIFWLSFKNKSRQKLKIFFAFLMAFSFFLVVGTKEPVGFVYKFLYENVPFLKIFREPYTKFMPVYIFSACFGLTFSLEYLFEKINGKNALKNVLILIVSAAVLANAYPLFTKEAIAIRRWNLFQIGSVLKVPPYWSEAKSQLEKRKLDEQTLLLPYNLYSSAHNLEYGTNIVGNLADYLVRKKFVRGWETDRTSGGQRINQLFEANPKAVDWQRYLGRLGVRKVLVENDIEWRYSKDKIASPSKTRSLLERQKFSKDKEFGMFTPEYLSRILNQEPDEKINNEFYEELANRPALVSYDLDDQHFFPHFYASKSNLVSGQGHEDLTKMISDERYQSYSAFIFKEQNVTRKAALEKVTKDNLEGEHILEFKKINPTKYRVMVHGAKGGFLMVFSESFHDGWKAYLNRNAGIKNQDDDWQRKTDSYRVLDGNDYDQASPSELEEFIEKGWVSTLGDREEKKIKHKKLEKGKEVTDYLEKYTIDFISKNFQGTIQNDNLSEGNVFETWFQTPIDNQENHLVANGYANSWFIDADNMCHNGYCRKNPDGTYDFELIVEFHPQRFLYLGFLMSAMTFLSCVGYLVWDCRKNKPSK
jgi:hypothetical protein